MLVVAVILQKSLKFTIFPPIFQKLKSLLTIFIYWTFILAIVIVHLD